MPRYRNPLRVPQQVVGYDSRLVQAAGALLDARGPDFLAVLDAIAAGLPIGSDDRACFSELAATARQVLVSNQIAPDGYRVHREPYGDAGSL